MYFFPDTCFYEFIPEDEMEKSFDDPSYEPPYLSDGRGAAGREI